MIATIERAIERRPFIRLAATALAAGAIGCRRRDPDGARRSTLIIAAGEDESGLVAVDNDLLKYLVFLPLLTTNEDGELEGRLAERWEHSADFRNWTFHLRPGIRWHDGVPVTAHDVKFTLELFSHPDVLELAPHRVESSTVLDDATIQVRFGSLASSKMFSLGYEIVLPKHLLAHLIPKEYAEWDFWTRPVGNGPYRFAHYLPQTMMQFDANPDYYRGKRSIAHVVLKFTRGAEIAELVSGNVDVVLDADLGHAAAQASWRAYYGLSALWEAWPSGIAWNSARPQLSDTRVRRALTLALNRPELARVLNLPDGVPAVDGPFTPRQLRRGEVPEPLLYDPAQSRALLDAAGWRQRGGGLRERDGQLFRFTLLIGGERGSSQLAVYLQEAWRRVGISADIETLDRNVLRRRVGDRRFDACLSWPVLDKRWFGANSPLGYRNTQVVRLLERLPSAIDPAENDDIHRQLTAIFRVDIPATFLFPRVATVFASRRVRGLSSPWRVDPIRFIDELLLDDGRHR